jgi:structural maintenance of chromosome 3 (chondroitin sulfate proteoglycan 6)
MALQRAAPGSSSFFILDEVDAALDSNYRSAIAEALSEGSARGVQFLFTSFRPEFCSVGNKHWLVSMVNGTSQVRLVDVASAMMLVNGQDENEAPPNLNISSQHEVSLRE